jgi:hypothetical protein
VGTKKRRNCAEGSSIYQRKGRCVSISVCVSGSRNCEIIAKNVWLWHCESWAKSFFLKQIGDVFILFGWKIQKWRLVSGWNLGRRKLWYQWKGEYDTEDDAIASIYVFWIQMIQISLSYSWLRRGYWSGLIVRDIDGVRLVPSAFFFWWMNNKDLRLYLSMHAVYHSTL